MADGIAHSASSADTATPASTMQIKTDEASSYARKEGGREPMSPRLSSAQHFFHKRTSLDLDDYFTGPRDMAKHSKWPLLMRMHGSIVPKLIVPLLIVGAWATLITVLNRKLGVLGVSNVLLTITGFVISLGLSFRSSTAYERYAEGRKFWANIILSSQALGRVIWVHTADPPEKDSREMMLKKVSAMNLVVAFSVALKHSLRFEPFTAHSDMQHLIGHLTTYAQEATLSQPQRAAPPKKSFMKEVGEYLGVSFAESNPRKLLKKSDQPLGNLPLEILNHLAVAIDEMVRNQQLDIPMQQTLAYNNLNMLNDALVGCERVLNTPLPIAYAIAISQITWVYVMLLPFQLVEPLEWIAIPATIAASYIILGLLFIGSEIENPFGHDVNDLPLDVYCEQVAHDMDVIASFEKRDCTSFMTNHLNMPLFPVSTAPVDIWMQRSEEKLRETIKNKPNMMFRMKRAREEGKPIGSEDMV
ncbi:unnamed protein product [Clonostachys rosea f. rosea IK726]|uniref:Uncharacterized protein n=1 Tax=Clonostachys rosea f. rosea IK726 TaxID=1349383 RepID=A0ACA9TSS7_BIOOC|nr:unnamed protein product [Clonostachys rosea f. rosea IK726]